MENFIVFGEAIEALKSGNLVAREGWNGKGMYLQICLPSDDDKNLLPFIEMKTADDKYVPWLASQTDMLAEDWFILED